MREIERKDTQPIDLREVKLHAAIDYIDRKLEKLRRLREKGTAQLIIELEKVRKILVE